LAAGLLLVMLGLAAGLAVPIVLPEGRSVNFLGLHYSLPLMMPLVWIALVVMAHATGLTRGQSRGELWGRFLRYLSFIVSLTVVIWCHLNIKLWIPLINPVSFDNTYQASDLWLGPLVAALSGLRATLAAQVPTIDTWYLFFFIFMFFASFTYHAIFDAGGLSRVFLAILLIEAIGPLCYLIAPAAGPFLFEPGVNRVARMNQEVMWAVHLDIRNHGTAWLAENGAKFFPAGLAAMPSLHAGAPWIFLHYLYKARSTLLPISVVLFAWIVIEAVVAKWHYVVDLPAGIALALVCIWLSECFHGR
jgi:hypothetical protein